jgi:hypothetical protein
MTWFTQREQTCPEAEDRNSTVIQGERATRAGLSLAEAYGKRAGVEIDLAPLE